MRGTPYNGLYGEAAPERGTFFRLQIYKRVGFHKFRYMKGYKNLHSGIKKGLELKQIKQTQLMTVSFQFITRYVKKMTSRLPVFTIYHKPS